jgi:hypothetical protein
MASARAAADRKFRSIRYDTPVIRTTLILLGLALLLGCQSTATSRQVTGQKAYELGYASNEVYVLVEDLSLYRWKRTKGQKFLTVRADRNDPQSMTRLHQDAYILAPAGTFENGHFADLSAGARFEITNLWMNTVEGLGNVIMPYGSLLQDPHEGRYVVLTYVSDIVEMPGSEAPATQVQIPDPKYIRLFEPSH